MTIKNSTAENVAQMVGSHGSSINQSSVSNDLKTVLEAIDRLVATVKSSPTVSADAKKDCQIEADQLKGELNKSKPNPNRLKEGLEWFKTLTGAVEVVPKVMEVVDKLKVFLPGVF